MGFRTEKDQEEKAHFRLSLEAIWGDKWTRILFPFAWLPFCCPEKLCLQIVYQLPLYIYSSLCLSYDFTLSLFIWLFMLLIYQRNLLCSNLSLFHLVTKPLCCSYLNWDHHTSFYLISFSCLLLSLSFFFHECFLFLFLYHSYLSACQPVCLWQLKITPVKLQHPVVHCSCQVPCCHGNYAELSRCPVDI